MFPRPLGVGVLVKEVDPQQGRFPRPAVISLMRNGEPDEPLPGRGIVVAVGPGHLVGPGEWMPLEVQVGDEVMFFSQAGITMVIDGETLYLLQEQMVLLILSRVAAPAEREP